MTKESARSKILDMREENRPRERLISEGAQALSDGELLAVLLGSGVPGINAIELGNLILKQCGGFSGIHRTEIAELQDIPGVGMAKAARIKAAVELGNRLAKERGGKEKITIRGPEDVVRLVGLDLRGKEQEELWVIWLNVRNQVLGIDRLYKGSQDSSSVRVGEIFARAIRNSANAVILAHNHPSGEAAESPEDVNLTRAVIEAGRLLDIRVHDHIIIGREDFSSIKQNHPALWV
jgi:DNA repair protein RadC